MAAESSTERSHLPRRTRVGLWLLSAVLFAVGAFLAIGGAWLAAVGGSWYYVLAGVGMLIAAIGVARRRRWGAAWYGAVVLGTLIWTAYESGLDYWRWVPRFGLVVALAFWLALLLPRLEGGPPRRVARGFASVFAAVFIAAVALAFVQHGAASAAPAAPLRAAAPRPSGGDWPAYGGSNAALRYSPLTQIDRGNVSKLERAWVYRTGDLPPTRWGAETTPLEISDTVYLCSARNVLIALDGSKGTERWRYDPHVSDDAIPYTAACRGVAYYESPQAASCPTRVIEGTLDGRLIAVDAATGTPCEGFGTHGAVDITVGMGKTSPGMVSINSPPAIVRGVIVTGHQVLDGQRRNAPSGVIQGFDAVTGELRWAWDMVHPDRTGAPPPGETYARGTPNSWTAPSADED
ncbi:MAG TPA: membrane-bound PQQ-dependent dehydrogenase, glucose/quinate/shikimate family, partial [Gammaproteobacteria bacterium]|nr:membrane-bound PQQ-dependent dehydrogenase, glucose/quinate/shikimate family [Gammaproteobacteria bacterium]